MRSDPGTFFQRMGRRPTMAEASKDERLERLEKEQADLEARLARVERALAPQAHPAPAPAATESWREVDEPVTSPQDASAAPVSPHPGTRGAQGLGLEFRLGGRWLAVAGALLLVLGVIWFLLLAFDRGWIGPLARVLLGILLGAALWGAGAWLDRSGRIHVYGQLLSAAGAAVLYFAVYAAAHFEEYRALTGWSQEMGSVALAIVASVLLGDAWWRRAQWLAGMSLALVAVTVTAGQQWAAFSVVYTVLFVVAVQLTGALRGWVAIQLAALPVGYGLLFWFLVPLWDIDPRFIVGGAAALLTVASLGGFLSQRLAGPDDARRGVIQAGAWVGAWGLAALSFGRLQWWGDGGGLLTGFMGVAALVLAFVPYASLSARWGWGLAGLFLVTVWVPVALTGVAVSFVWVLFTGMLLAAAAWRRSAILHGVAAVLAAIVVVRVLFVEMVRFDAGELSVALATLVVVTGSSVLIGGWVLGAVRSQQEAGAGVPVHHLTWLHLAGGLLLPLVYLAVLLEGAWITLAWAGQAVAVLGIGALLGRAPLRWAGLALFVPVLSRVLFVDLAGVDPVWRVLSYLGVGAIFLLVSYAYARAQRQRRGAET